MMLVNSRPTSKVHPPFDAEAALREARARLPLRRVMEQRGVPVFDRKSIKCPFCGSGSAGFFTREGQEFFKCHHTSCPTETKALDEVGFIMASQPALNRKEAFQVYLKDAGVWKERTVLKAPGGLKAPRSKIQDPKKLQAPSSNHESRITNHEAPTNQPSSEAGSEAAQSESSLPPAGASPVAGPAGVSVLPTTPTQMDHTPPTLISPPGQATAGNDAGGVAVTSEPVTSEPVTSEQSKIVVLPDQKAESGKLKSETEMERPPATALDVVHAFFAGLSLSEADEERLWKKRGLESRTSDLLGFKSGARSNKDLLLKLHDEFEVDLLLESGLWKRGGKGRGGPKPNAQFYGMGLLGKAPSPKLQAPNKSQTPSSKTQVHPLPGPLPSDGRGSQKELVDEDGNLWGWCEPILIPYRDDRGRLIKLRPHKGGAAGDTLCGEPMLYVPRPADGYDVRQAGGPSNPLPGPLPSDGRGSADGGGLPYRERFHTVLVTEGEFKAAAAWQVIGAGRQDGARPVGVCAVPGIQFANHYGVLEALEVFVRRAGAERVVVVFDNEDKGTPGMPGFKEDWRKRHDAAIWAGVLATRLYERLNLRQAAVGMLDAALRDEAGKVDFDGMAAMVLVASNQ